MTAAQLELLRLAPHTVLRDASGIVWVKAWRLFQRPGSLGDYDASAIILPYAILWEPPGVPLPLAALAVSPVVRIHKP